MNQEDDRYPKAIPFPSCEEFVSWQDRCLHLDSSISSPILSPATEFPFNNKGELVKELIHDYNHHELKLVSYRDIVLGRGQPVNAKNLKVTFHYDLYNTS
ncbi:hypothetical protein GH714_042315 [Hevea brasiliensis]|uniref:Uncharacterized protein n=1 Tax=Hevea brasiliensis TaxID=3981 RepID=A0A6A6KAV6_HEVBR|nr:hypothetical protein GH714_042315 [Hevea brasiliensis]